MSSSKATAKTYAEGPGVKVDREICGTRPVEGIEPGESPHKLTEEEERMLARQRGHELSASMQARIEREAMVHRRMPSHAHRTSATRAQTRALSPAP